MIWTAHFGLIYAISSVSVQIAGETTMLARALIVGSGVLGVLAAAVVLLLALRLPEEPVAAFWRNVSALGAILSAIAIVWQSLPAVAPI